MKISGERDVSVAGRVIWLTSFPRREYERKDGGIQRD